MLRDFPDRVMQVVAKLRGKFGDMMAFDLSKLTWAGWIIFITSFAVAILCSFLVASLGWFADEERPPPLAGVLISGVAVGWFFGWRWLFSKFGIPFYDATKGDNDES